MQQGGDALMGRGAASLIWVLGIYMTTPRDSTSHYTFILRHSIYLVKGFVEP